MTDPGKDLRATLVDLHAQLSDARNVDPEVRALLKNALAEIEETLEAGETESARSEPAEDASLTERLTETARQFETSHPTLAAAVESLVNTLAQMGI